MSVLIINPQFRPIVGGYERAAERLARCLTRFGTRVTVVTERRDTAWPASEKCGQVEVRRLYCVYRRHLHGLTALLSLAMFLLIYGRRFDVWHVQQYGANAALAACAGKLLNRPVVLKLTSSAGEGIASAAGTGISRPFINHWLKRVSACLALSEDMADEAKRFGIKASRIIRIPNGIDTSEFPAVSAAERLEAKRKLGIDPIRLVVLYVGRLSEEKNPLALIEAWSTTAHSLPTAALLVLVGDGPQRRDVEEKIATLDLGNQVRVAGHQSDVHPWYAAADIYVLPSRHEGLSNTMLEAMACGLPVVSTAVSGTAVLRQSAPAGIVVPVGDTMALAAAIARLIKDGAARQQLGANGRRIVEAEFSLDGVTRRTLSLYERLVSRRSPT